MSANYSKEKLTLVNELIYQIKVKEAMSRKVISFKENTTFREIQLKLKEKKISGVPILDDKKNIVGIISIDDVITAFDKGYVDKKITDYMSREVITIPRNFSVVSAINRLEKFKVGRLPVTESSNSKKIVGMITLSDILNRLLVVVQSIAEKVEDKEIKNTQISHNLIKSWCDQAREEILKGKLPGNIENFVLMLELKRAFLYRLERNGYEDKKPEFTINI